MGSRSLRERLRNKLGREPTRSERDGARARRDERRSKRSRARRVDVSTTLSDNVVRRIAQQLLVSATDEAGRRAVIAMAGACKTWAAALSGCWHAWLTTFFPHVQNVLRQKALLADYMYKRMFLNQLRAAQPPPHMARVYERDDYFVTAWLRTDDGRVLASATSALNSRGRLKLGAVPELAESWHSGLGSSDELPISLSLDLAVTQKWDLDMLYLVKGASGRLNEFHDDDLDGNRDYKLITVHFPGREERDLPLPIWLNSPYQESRLESRMRQPSEEDSEEECGADFYIDAYAEKHGGEVVLHYQLLDMPRGYAAGGMDMDDFLAYLATDAPWPSRCAVPAGAQRGVRH